jgi:hypothetical protein
MNHEDYPRFTGQHLRELDVFQRQRKQERVRDEVVASVREMLSNDMSQRPDWWQQWAVDLGTLSEVVAEYLIVRSRNGN